MQRDNVSQCRYCGKRIRFIRMSSGKAMPVDDLLVNYRVDASGKDRIVTPNGEVVVGVANVQANDADGKICQKKIKKEPPDIQKTQKHYLDCTIV